MERQRFLVQDRVATDALELPRGGVAEFVVVAGALAFARLMLFTEVAAARFIAMQRVAREQFGELQEVGDATGVFEVLVERLTAAEDFHVGPEFFAKLLDRVNRLEESLLVAAHPDMVPHDVAECPMKLFRAAFAVHFENRLDARFGCRERLAELGGLG